AEVAAALLARSRGPEPAGDAPAAPAAPGDARWTKIFVNVGKKDGVGAKDLVGALIREVKVDKADIGKIETRETFSTVLLAARAADRAVRGLSGISIRGRRVTARPDKFAAAEGNARATSR
ncbi:MAG TPA: DbpA RNA binding domain-containing protein, partial [Gemmatimonadales bacterium]|nr:DbpA RNA binding domain-containing protein [Gemmatimonadales bacterium]